MDIRRLLFLVLVLMVLGAGPVLAADTWQNPTMTANNYPYGVITASEEHTGREGYRAFDHTVGGGEFWSAVQQAAWLQYRFEYGNHAVRNTTVTTYYITANTANADRSPKTWVMQASNDATTWVTVDTVASQTGWVVGETKTFLVDSPALWIYYRLNISANQGNVGYTAVGELQLWGNNETADTEPPASITGLTNTSTSCNSTGWSWYNPLNADLYQVITYKNGVLDANLSNSTTSATWNGLSQGTWYNISTKTKDLTGNINASWVNGSAFTQTCWVAPTTAPTPTVTVLPTVPDLPAPPWWWKAKGLIMDNAWWLIAIALLLGIMGMKK